MGDREFSWNTSFEYFAWLFERETGRMAPGKDDRRPRSSEEIEETRDMFGRFMDTFSAQAFSEWHERHGYLSDSPEAADFRLYIGMDEEVDDG
jgi:hypothetical protein